MILLFLLFHHSTKLTFRLVQLLVSRPNFIKLSSPNASSYPKTTFRQNGHPRSPIVGARASSMVTCQPLPPFLPHVKRGTHASRRSLHGQRRPGALPSHEMTMYRPLPRRQGSRRSRRALRPQRHLRRHRRVMLPEQRVPRRRRVQVHRRRPHLDQRRPKRHPAHSQNSHPSSRPQPGLRSRPRPYLGP